MKQRHQKMTVIDGWGKTQSKDPTHNVIEIK